MANLNFVRVSVGFADIMLVYLCGTKMRESCVASGVGMKFFVFLCLFGYGNSAADCRVRKIGRAVPIGMQ